MNGGGDLGLAIAVLGIGFMVVRALRDLGKEVARIAIALELRPEPPETEPLLRTPE